VNDTTRALLEACKQWAGAPATGGAPTLLGTLPDPISAWAEAGCPDLEPPSREGKVKVVVRGHLDSEGACFVSGWDAPDDDPISWGQAEARSKQARIGEHSKPVEIVAYLEPHAVEVVEDVEVVE